MKTIVESGNHRAPAASPGMPKRTSREADRELAHIQEVVMAVRATSVPLPISVGYWRTRIHELRLAYALLPVQVARLSALELDVKNIARDEIDVLTSDERRVA